MRADSGARAFGGSAAACAGLVKIYRTPTGEVHALKGVDAAFEAGAVTAVMGPSGSGKSSLLRILSCIDRPTGGRVELAGREVSELGPGARARLRRRLIGYVFQRPSDNLIADLTVAEHLRLAARLRGARGWRTEGAELLEVLGLGAAGRRLPHQLSGGEQQRLAFATATIGQPALVVADEPTAELDSASVVALLDAMDALAGLGASFVVATHDPAVVARAHRTLHLRHGALEAESFHAAALAVIDSSGRIQLPPELLKLFPARRAKIGEDGGRVWISPP